MLLRSLRSRSASIQCLDRFCLSHLYLPQSTLKRSTLRITREAELLGGDLSAYHSRENLVLRCKFLRDDLPYFTELLGEVVSKTRYTSQSAAMLMFMADFI